MQAFLEPLKELADYQEIVSSRRKKTGFLQIAGCVNSQKIHLAKALSDGFEYRVIVFSSEEKAKQAYEEWRVLEENVWFYPARDLLFYHADIKGAFLTGRRMEVLRAVAEKKEQEAVTVVTTMDAFLDRTSPDVIKEVERVLERKLSSLINQDYTIVGGVDAIVGILNTVDRGTEKHIMESLEIEEPELADEIRKKMFVFEDILLLDDRAIQRVLRDVDNNDLAVALKGANEEVQNVIFKNLSKRLAAMIREDMEFMGPVRMKDVEEAQQKIVGIIRKLEDSAEIVISRGGGDEIIV